ncbi:uncharacterized protein FIESC28_07197 [Fusarium coffeatum]|uniref:Uncharacterized protein n=1 Tax=Fusarium coffeatum TaxID=231269 RepID=A0A366RHB2_9HYPO|nr:uncharacterized protein FIESC28_07197 [Fusarium coffeatum]RBR15796.1 hypothetical protein FIESC28_07197 [Fusarium coffeatum]
MNYEKRIQNRKARTSISTDTTSTDGMLLETQSSPSLSRKENSGDSSSVSKFSEAMNNPDWRRRRERCSTCDSMGDSIATASSSQNWSIIRPIADNDSSTDHSNNRRSDSWDLINNANSGRSVRSLDSSEAETKGKSVALVNQGHISTADGDNVRTAPSEDVGEDLHGLCVLLENMEIIDSPDEFGVLRLTPLFSNEIISQSSGQVLTDNGRAYTLAHIQRSHGRHPQWEVTGEGIKNLPQTTSEEHRSQPASSHYQLREERHTIPRSSGEESIERAREAVFHDPAVANIGSMVDGSRVKTAEPSVSKSSNPTTKEAFGPRNEAFRKIVKRFQQTQTDNTKEEAVRKPKEETEQRTEAFKKLLRKLHSGSSGSHRYPGATDSEGSLHRWEVIKEPQGVTQQLKTNSSEFETGSTHANNPRKEVWSHDSGVCMDGDPLKLNPRAREFLSFKSFTRASESSDCPNESDEESIRQTCLDRGSEESDLTTNQSVETGSATLDHPLSFKKPEHDIQSVRDKSKSETSSLPFGGQNPAALDSTANLSPFSNAALRFGAYQVPMQSAPPPGLLSSIGLGPMLGNQFTLPTGNTAFQPYSVASNPLVGLNTTPQWPYNPAMGSGLYPTCPPPVLKPTVPDTSQQQQYEAYVEWRKANEPGYALACKSRQQRRAQRIPIRAPTTLENMRHSQGQTV